MPCTDQEIASVFGFKHHTVERRREVQRFSDVMEQARAKGRVSGGPNLFRIAGKGNLAHRLPGLIGYRDVGAMGSTDGWQTDSG